VTLLERVKQPLQLALPIMAGMVSFNVMMVVDTAMVGQLGAASLAGAGLGGFLSGLVASILTGMPVGVQAIVARRMGEGAPERAAESLNGGLTLAVVAGVPITVLGIAAAPAIFPLIENDPEVVSAAVGYFRAIMINNATFAMTMAFEGYFNGTRRPKIVMRIMIMVNILNIVFDYLLIFGKLGLPALGVVGAGLATALAGICGAGVYFFVAWRRLRGEGFLQGKPSRALLMRIARIAVPASVNNTLTAAAFLVFFWLVGLIGVLEMAAANVLLRLRNLLLLPAFSLGAATTTLVGQALGGREPEEAARWGWACAWIGLAFIALISAPLILAPRWSLGFFLTDSAAVELAAVPLQLHAAASAFFGMGIILINAVMGAGDSRRAMVLSLALQWLLALPSVYLFGPGLGYGLLGVSLAQLGFGLVLPVAFGVMWSKGRWKTVEV